MMQALELLRLAKSTSQNEATLIRGGIKPVACIELHLSEGIIK